MIQEIKASWSGGYKSSAIMLALWGYILWWLLPLGVAVTLYSSTVPATLGVVTSAICGIAFTSWRFEEVGELVSTIIEGVLGVVWAIIAPIIAILGFLLGFGLTFLVAVAAFVFSIALVWGLICLTIGGLLAVLSPIVTMSHVGLAWFYGTFAIAAIKVVANILSK